MSNIITALATYLIRLLEFLLFARAILSWFPQAQGSKLGDFLYEITEPIIMPFRALLSRFEFVRTMPIDISFLCAFLVLEMIQGMLYQL